MIASLVLGVSLTLYHSASVRHNEGALCETTTIDVVAPDDLDDLRKKVLLEIALLNRQIRDLIEEIRGLRRAIAEGMGTEATVAELEECRTELRGLIRERRDLYEMLWNPRSPDGP